MSASFTRKIRCPNCNKLCEYAPSNLYRPFCSERCKLIDLGCWANESYKLADNTSPVSENEQ